MNSFLKLIKPANPCSVNLPVLSLNSGTRKHKENCSVLKIQVLQKLFNAYTMKMLHGLHGLD
jgi:hypothetical protein